MRYAFYTSSQRAWTAMFETIRSAEHSIYIEMYIMVDDTEGFDFFALLEEKARAGLTVKLVLDSFGSFAVSRAAVSSLKEAGAEVLFYSRFFRRMHRKTVIVDEQVVISGGVNIHQSASAWRDLAFRISGQGYIHSFLRSFTKAYFRAGGEDSSLRRFSRRSILSRIGHLPGRQHRTLRHFYEAKISAAQRSICLIAPYFAPDRWLITALDQASLRGVSVEILIPKRLDIWFMARVNNFYMLKMSKTHAKFFLYPHMNHAKALLLDREEGLIGSHNLDSLSFNINKESGIFFADREMVADLTKIIEGWKAESELFVSSEHKRQWYDYLLAPIIRILRPIL